MKFWSDRANRMRALLGAPRFHAWASRAILLLCLGVAATASGCAAENKITKGPHFSLNHPDFWKVKSVASKDGEPTQIGIGKYSETVMSDGAGSTASAQYEASQAEVDVRIYTWPGIEDGGAPSRKVAEQLIPVDELTLRKSGQMNVAKNRECGADFGKKYIIFGTTQEPLDLLSQPGFRTIIVGTKTNNILYGVLARVPFEQDTGLYCHNLHNMQTQLQLLLEGLTAVADAPAAPAAAAAPADPAKAAETAVAPK